MDNCDKKIFENRLAVPIGKAISEWLRQNEITDPVVVGATVGYPSCYIDEKGVSHTGPLIVCNVHIVDDADDDDYDDDLD